ncbi:hypothetical protein LIER_31916 [Lithospermum erythrorhizon]|uniref:DYW domain-containing protein n=1 Tax=Lithospermum erythrorhizon TaxID=34254 RepID=A0AAV3RU87_LITER
MQPYSTRIFHQVDYPNPFVYTALIRGYCNEKNQEKGVEMYRHMRVNYVDPVSFTLTCLLKSCSDEENLILGRQMHKERVTIGGFCRDVFVCNTLIDMYVKCGELGDARKVFDEMPKRDVISWTTLIVAYMKKGDTVGARVLFRGLDDKDMVAWTAMVTGFEQNGRPREALRYFEMMMNSGVEADELTLVGVISACAQLGAIKYAGWVRNMAERLGFGPEDSVFMGSSLIDMYSKCGSVMEAYEVFKGMRVKNVFSYSSMIVGFAAHGCGKAAFDLFEEMIKTDIKPNKVTFIGVLSACSHSGLVDEGRKYFDMMEKWYGVVPDVDHYTCLIDLLGRAGQLEEALHVIRDMPMEPHGGIWGAVLGACRIHKNPDIAEFAANHLFELEPDGIGNYVLLANIYASVGRWEGVQKVRKLVRERGLRKNPACSWVEGEKGIIHEFYSNDATHPKSREIELVLKDLLQRLKLQGYEPNLSSVPYDLSEEEKKKILYTHSEKLALAYALLTSDNFLPIRIMKNLRICEDCHLFMCAASQITSREIIIRDNVRFHHFRDGKCSCGNFW